MVDTKIIYTHIAQKLREYRLSKQINQSELEAIAGLTQGHISRIEKGEIKPKVDTLLAIGLALNLTIDEITDLFSFAEVLVMVNNVNKDYQ